MIDSPTRKHAARTSLTDMVNVAVRIEKDYLHSMLFDTEFDGGEFSSDFIWGAAIKEMAFELQYSGWTALDFDKAIVERCGARWYHFNFGFVMGLIDELIRQEDIASGRVNNPKQRAARRIARRNNA